MPLAEKEIIDLFKSVGHVLYQFDTSSVTFKQSLLGRIVKFDLPVRKEQVVSWIEHNKIDWYE